MPGPVIITDDGGPPLMNRNKDAVHLMTVGCQGELMPELEYTNAGTPHRVNNSHAISRVTVIKDDIASTAQNYQAAIVIVSGASTKITVGNVNGVQVYSDHSLPDVPQNGWDRYQSNDPRILSVQLDQNTPIDTSKWTGVKVQIEIL
jgi:hypothetical protein